MKLVWDARQCEVYLNGLHIVARPQDSAPFAVQATVEEEDTHRVLGAYHNIRNVQQTTKQLVTEMLNVRPMQPGKVVVTGKFPKRLLAIVHDLEQDPTWRVEWVNSALKELFQIVARDGYHSVAIPILGGVHGHISPTRFVKMMRSVLEQYQPKSLERLWLILPPDESCRILEPLKGLQVVNKEN